MTNLFLQNFKTGFVDPFKKSMSMPLPSIGGNTPVIKPLTLNTNTGMVSKPPVPNISYTSNPSAPNMLMTPTVPVQPRVAPPIDQNVLAQQKALNNKGAGLKEDGIMGPLTQAAIKRFATPTPPPSPTPISTLTADGKTINPATGGVSGTVPPPPPPSPTPATPAVPVPTPYETSVTDAEKAYTTAGQMTPEEEAAQAELDRLSSSFKTGYQGVEDQTIPMEFITGQQKSLENRALNLAEPLNQKLARLQAKRMSALETSKFALERADTKLKTETDKTKPMEGTSFYDPVTGTWKTAPEKIKPAEDFTLSEGQIRYDAQGKEIARGGAKATAFDKDQNPDRVLSVEEAKNLGVPFGTTAGKAYGTKPGDEKLDKANAYSSEKADRAITLVDEALGKVSGWTTGFGALLGAIPATEARDFAALVDSIKANIGFNELSAMRAASPTGGALGQVAVQELNFLQSVLGSLDAKQKPATVKANLEKIKTHFNNWKATLGAGAGGAGTIQTTIGPINTNW